MTEREEVKGLFLVVERFSQFYVFSASVADDAAGIFQSVNRISKSSVARFFAG